MTKYQKINKHQQKPTTGPDVGQGFSLREAVEKSRSQEEKDKCVIVLFYFLLFIVLCANFLFVDYSVIKSYIIDFGNRTICDKIQYKIGGNAWKKLKKMFIKWDDTPVDRNEFVKKIKATSLIALKLWYKVQEVLHTDEVVGGVCNAVGTILNLFKQDLPVS
jgi:hypothetical protein